MKHSVEIAGEIVARLEPSNATGEWAWINENRRKGYLRILAQRDPEALAGCLSEMFTNGAAYGIFGSEAGDLATNVALDLDTLREFFGLEVIPLKNPHECGNIPGIWNGEGLITPDMPRHTYFADRLLSLIKHIERPTIFEIGGGYGGLIREVLLRRQVRYINCDLPETLYLAYFFLRKAMPHLSIKWIDEDIVGADVVMVPSSKRDAVTACDVAFNCHSLSEMGKDTVADYIGLINRLRPQFFLHQNSDFVLYPNSPRHIEIRARDFPVDPNVFTLKTRTISPWHGGGGRYREFLYQRIG